MSKVTAELIDNVYDAITVMRLFSQRLSEGEIDDTVASEMSWLLGSAKKRLEPVINVLERIESGDIPSIPAKQNDAGSVDKYLEDLLREATEEGQFMAQIDELFKKCQALKASFRPVVNGNEGGTH